MARWASYAGFSASTLRCLPPSTVWTLRTNWRRSFLPPQRMTDGRATRTTISGESMPKATPVGRVLPNAFVTSRPLCAGRNYAQIAPGHVVDSAATRLLASLISVDLNIVSAADRSGGSTYVEADLAIKEKAPAHLEPAHTTMRRFEAPDSRTRFLRTV